MTPDPHVRTSSYLHHTITTQHSKQGLYNSDIKIRVFIVHHSPKRRARHMTPVPHHPCRPRSPSAAGALRKCDRLCRSPDPTHTRPAELQFTWIMTREYMMENTTGCTRGEKTIRRIKSFAVHEVSNRVCKRGGGGWSLAQILLYFDFSA